MPLLKFRIYWEEDDLIYRDIDILSSQTFMDFHQAILKAYDFDGKHSARFFESNDRWERLRIFSSEVLSNKKGAAELSMVKTPVSALVSVPDQKFIYEYDPAKKWTFLVELIGVSNDVDPKRSYPTCTRKEGMAPMQYKPGGGSGMLMEIEEKYDLGEDEMAEGFGSEGDSEEGGSEESYSESDF
ncbi:IS1096 element passenger TnpR family protein [Rurimicrobium arvi]|uniref:Plasmid pRiA4b Orf3-like domain-containing protein n=1 Tax=Rurimicrobium arvi TaxID=2049916 RepID=A0ABP8MZU9_9BACT